MHINKCELVKKINIKLVGHYRYYGITGRLSENSEKTWKKGLGYGIIKASKP